MRRAIVVLSGGQDSTTCLFWALREFGRDCVASLTFDYGQRHRIELACASKVAGIAGVPHTVLPIDTFAALGGNALTDARREVPEHTDSTHGLPDTFVPGRNLIFLTFAAAYAYPHGITELVVGVGQADYSGYPDCREDTMRALETSLRLGMERDFTIHAPLMHRSKADTVRLAHEVGAFPALAWTHTCYRGEQPPCGRCPACALRAEGFRESGIPDPLLERLSGQAS
jgi:7-cyano-7-deazaguanine synthase